MATLQDYQTEFSKINEDTNNIAADIERLTGLIEEGGMTAAEEESALAELKTLAEKIKGIAATTPDGDETPPVEP